MPPGDGCICTQPHLRGQSSSVAHPFEQKKPDLSAGLVWRQTPVRHTTRPSVLQSSPCSLSLPGTTKDEDRCSERALQLGACGPSSGIWQPSNSSRPPQNNAPGFIRDLTSSGYEVGEKSSKLDSQQEKNFKYNGKSRARRAQLDRRAQFSLRLP